ncbi:DMT family transporter [Microbacterium sp. cx-55]|uniref:DMT family transporter n=1 Tax=Microbacterium sp. cx-55 TaxID=2875948 RepID=UPI001CBFCDC8|nr:DMT family transporter [Microbacterium sp. cx-55]UGB34438.1 DMT family transporter [Microbacterium sp. cx-55]
MTSRSASAAPRRLPLAVALGGAVLVGVLTSVQAQINGALGAAIGDGFVAAVISFGSGLAILIVLSATVPSGRAGFGRLVRGVRERRIPFWMLIGGLAGAFTVASQGLTVAVIGVATFTVGVVAGQTVNGVVLDRAGYGPAGVVPVTVGRLLGGGLAVVAVVISLLGEGPSGVPAWMLFLPFLAGAGIAWQQATNGRLRHVVESPLTATLVNFIGGTLALLVAAGIRIAFVGLPASLPADPWVYFGGAIGVVYIFLSAALVRHTGVLQLGLGSVVGLLLTSVVIDAIWPAHSGPPLALALTAVALALVGVVIAVVPRWRRR